MRFRSASRMYNLPNKTYDKNLLIQFFFSQILFNRKEFVDAYVTHVFDVSVEGVFVEFKRGFYDVCDQDLIQLFQPKELQSVLVGEDFHAWERLRLVSSNLPSSAISSNPQTCTMVNNRSFTFSYLEHNVYIWIPRWTPKHSNVLGGFWWAHWRSEDGVLVWVPYGILTHT